MSANFENWARELAGGLIDLRQLANRDLLPTEDDTLTKLNAVKDVFDIRVPQAFLKRIQNSEALKKQVVPSTEELVFMPEERTDPIGDERWSPRKGLTHRYPDRVLLKLTHHCAVYCRFCFRRYKVSHEGQLSSDELRHALSYIEQNPDIREVILTGGDPLTLTDSKLFEVLDAIAHISHVRIVRFHSRIPTVLPARLTDTLIQKLTSLPYKIWLVAHVNHGDELDFEARAAIARLQRAGIPLLAQSVLLRGVNDSFETLSELFYALVELGVKPYYLHYPDLAQGTNHFRVSLDRALELVTALRGQISGLCIPQLIVDIPGGAGKVIVEPQWTERLGEGHWRFKSPLKPKAGATSGRQDADSPEWIEVRYPACQVENSVLTSLSCSQTI